MYFVFSNLLDILFYVEPDFYRTFLFHFYNFFIWSRQNYWLSIKCNLGELGFTSIHSSQLFTLSLVLNSTGSTVEPPVDSSQPRGHQNVQGCPLASAHDVVAPLPPQLVLGCKNGPLEVGVEVGRADCASVGRADSRMTKS